VRKGKEGGWVRGGGEGNVGTAKVPALQALNETLRADYIEDFQKGLSRLNGTLRKAGIDAALTLPHPGFRRILRPDDQIGDALCPRADGDRKRSADRSDRTIQRQLSYKDVVIEGGDGAHRAQNAERHGQVEA